MTARSANKVINFRAPRAKQDLIDRAVRVSGKSRTEFILDAACDRAREVLADRTEFALDKQSWKRFNALLDAPLAEVDRLQRLLNSTPPWKE